MGKLNGWGCTRRLMPLNAKKFNDGIIVYSINGVLKCILLKHKVLEDWLRILIEFPF